MGFTIVSHAFRTVFGNFSSALKVSVGPFLVSVVIIALFTVLLGSTAIAPLIVLLALVTIMIVFAWVAVSWHRFVLLEEYPRALPRFSDVPVLPYFGKTIVLTLTLIIPLFLIMLVLSPLLPATQVDLLNPAAGVTIGQVLVNVVFGTLFSFFWFRIAMGLPGVALGKPMSISQSWNVTAPASGVIFGTVITFTALSFAANFVLGLLAGPSVVLGSLLSIVVVWTTMMIGISLLTTFYGHLVEGRDLV